MRVNDSMGTEKSECDKPKMMGWLNTDSFKRVKGLRQRWKEWTESGRGRRIKEKIGVATEGPSQYFHVMRSTGWNAITAW